MRGEVAIPFKLIAIINTEKKKDRDRFFFLSFFPSELKPLVTHQPITIYIYTLLS